jgi:hypothetical protein
MAHQRLESYAGSVVRREAGRVRPLGGFSLSLGRHDIEADRWRLKKAAGLVKLLALAPGHKMHKERIMEALWPGVDARRASNNLHRTLHSARAVLVAAGAGHLPLRGDFVELCPDVPLWVDVEAFEDAARAAFRSGEPAAFRAAISLYAGDLLPKKPLRSVGAGEAGGPAPIVSGPASGARPALRGARGVREGHRDVTHRRGAGAADRRRRARPVDAPVRPLGT